MPSKRVQCLHIHQRRPTKHYKFLTFSETLATRTNFLLSFVLCLALWRFQSLRVQSSEPVRTIWSVGWNRTDVTQSKWLKSRIQHLTTSTTNFFDQSLTSVECIYAPIFLLSLVLWSAQKKKFTCSLVRHEENFIELLVHKSLYHSIYLGFTVKRFPARASIHTHTAFTSHNCCCYWNSIYQARLSSADCTIVFLPFTSFSHSQSYVPPSIVLLPQRL